MVDLPTFKLLTTLVFLHVEIEIFASVAIEFFARSNLRIVFVNGLESTS